VQSKYGVLNAAACDERTCTLRAPTAFSVRIKSIRTENAVLVKSKDGYGLLLSKVADCARMNFHPCAIGDPRERFFVRATSQRCNNGWVPLKSPPIVRL
jgi:hypothetical protein